MDELLGEVAAVRESARSAAVEARSGALRIASDTDLVDVLATLAEAQRLIDAMVVAAVEEVSRRSDHTDTQQRMTHRLGCASVSELLQRATLVSAATAGRWLKVAAALAEDTSITGEILPAKLPALRAALMDGVIGVDGALAVAGPLVAVRRTCADDEVATADAELAGAARGDASPPPSADLLRIQAQAWAEALDRDGAEPCERRMIRRRALTIGRLGDDGVPVHGMLLPEVAAQLQTIFDAVLSPRVHSVAFAEPGAAAGVDAPRDDRTRPQRQHDALATALSVAASSGLLPTVGGAAPTLVVSVRAEDLSEDSGHAYVEGAAVTIGTARHVGCAGVVQRVVLGSGGRVLRLGTEERVFNRHQRRAIALRDGGCIIPGCGVRAGWCEIHHVTEHARGGPTHTDNGVLLCWYHHRFLDRSGWHIRMNRGVPEVKAPSWFDASLRWRPVTTSRVRVADAVLRR